MKKKKNGKETIYKGVSEDFSTEKAQPLPTEPTKAKQEAEPASQTRLRRSIARFTKRT